MTEPNIRIEQELKKICKKSACKRQAVTHLQYSFCSYTFVGWFAPKNRSTLFFIYKRVPGICLPNRQENKKNPKFNIDMNVVKDANFNFGQNTFFNIYQKLSFLISSNPY